MALSGCQSPPPTDYEKHVAIYKSFITVINEMNDALNGVIDYDSSRVAADTIDQLTHEINRLFDERKLLNKLTEEEYNRLDNDYGRMIGQSFKRFGYAAYRAAHYYQGDPTISKSIKDFGKVVKDFAHLEIDDRKKVEKKATAKSDTKSDTAKDD